MPKLIWLAGLLFLVPLKVAAASAPLSTGITVAPAFITAQVGSKQNQTSATIGIRNNFEVPVTVSATLNGFDVRNNALVPTILAETNLGGVVSLSPVDIVVPPGVSKNITVIVHDTPNLSPGGHYLSILLTETAITGPVGTSQLSLRPAVSATLYIIKEDGAIRNIAVTKLSLKHSLFSLPSAADITYLNKGNVLLVPRGVIQIRHGIDSPVVAQGTANQQSAPLYPGANVTLQSKLQKLSNSHWPGRYNASFEYRYDGQQSSQQLRQAFWYIPKLFVVVTIIIIVLIVLLVWPANQRRVRRLWRLAHQPKRQPFVAPDVLKINKNMQNSTAQLQPLSTRRKIDDIRKSN